MGAMSRVEDRFGGNYFVFGESADGKFVDLADSEDTTVVGHISREDAEKLIAKRKALMGCLVDLYLALQKADEDALFKLWYPDQ